MHGHNYRVQVTFSGPELDSTGLLVDFVEVKKLMQTVVDRLDHQFLNDLAPFDVINPSAENIAKYFYDEISGGLGQSYARETGTGAGLGDRHQLAPPTGRSMRRSWR